MTYTFDELMEWICDALGGMHENDTTDYANAILGTDLVYDETDDIWTDQ